MKLFVLNVVVVVVEDEYEDGDDDEEDDEDDVMITVTVADVVGGDVPRVLGEERRRLEVAATLK